MSSQLRNRYRADLREIEFQLFEQAKLHELFTPEGPFGSWDRDTSMAVLQQTRQFVYDVTGPLNGYGDALGCRLVDSPEGKRVITPEGFKEAWKQLFELGLTNVVVSEEYGGQAGPHALQVMIEEMLTGANTSFNMYRA